MAKAPGRGRAVLRLLGSAVLMPLLVLAFGWWEQQRGGADEAEIARTQQHLARAVAALETYAGKSGTGFDMRMEFRRNGQLYGGPLALQEAREELSDVQRALWVAGARRVLPPVVIGASAAAAALSVLVLALASVLGWRGRATRDALVGGFNAMRRLLPLVLVLQIVLAIVGFVALVVFEVSPLLFAGPVSAGEVKLLGGVGVLAAFCVVAAVAALLQLRRALGVFTPDPLSISGRPVSRTEAPGLWRLLETLAGRLDALLPDNVVVGLTGGFFVSSGAKRLEPGGVPLSGRTLYLPLPYLALLRPEEVAAVIAHELAHFSGGDTEYSLRFLPIYAGVGRSLDAVASTGTGRGSATLLVGPALNLGAFVMDQFHRAVRHWSRRREFAADAAGAGATSAAAAAGALLRIAPAGALIGTVLRAAVAAPDAAPPDLVAAVLAQAAGGLEDPARHLEEEQPHPTDTHPPTTQRLAALHQVPDAALLERAAAPPPAEAASRLDGYFADPAAVGRAATADLLAVARHQAEGRRKWLRDKAAAVGTEATVLHENTRAVAVVPMVASVPILLAGALLLLDGDGDTATLAVVGAIVLVGLGLLGYGIVRFRRGDRPFLVLRPDVLEIPGLSVPIAWTSILDLDMTLTNRGMVTRMLLPADAPFPAAGGPGARPRKVKLDAKQRIVTVSAVLPRKMKPQGFADLLSRYRQAAHARQVLAAGEAQGVPPA